MQGMPGKYAPPRGRLLLARLLDGTPVGSVALRPIEPAGSCEMKRLYVSPEGRGMGIGKSSSASSRRRRDGSATKRSGSIRCRR